MFAKIDEGVLEIEATEIYNETKKQAKQKSILRFFSKSLATPTTSASHSSTQTPGPFLECEEEIDDPVVFDETPENEIFEL